MPGFWVAGPNDQVARRGLAASLRALGRAPSIQVELTPLVETDKEMVHQLQVEELAVEEAYQGRHVATLEVAMEVARLLTHNLLEGLGGFSRHAVVPP